MRRTDYCEIGRRAEDLAVQLLKHRGFEARNLNDEKRNYPLYDLHVERNGSQAFVSVKCARAKRELKLGGATQLKNLSDKCIVMAFLPAKKDDEIKFDVDGYELLIIPGSVVRDEALAAHFHYAKTHPGSSNHSVMVKDKVDRTTDTRSGAVFQSWHERFLNAWHIFNDVLA